MHLLGIGSGIGGPARYFARHQGCRVTGLDLTEEFVAVARTLTRRLGMEGQARMPDERGRYE
jgi:cyclopropane fatty-acyl-phospholipid synthase-like methyltransferase